MLIRYAACLAIVIGSASVVLLAILDDPAFFSSKRWFALIPLVVAGNYLLDRLLTGEGHISGAKVDKAMDAGATVFIDCALALVLIATLIYLA